MENWIPIAKKPSRPNSVPSLQCSTSEAQQSWNQQRCHARLLFSWQPLQFVSQSVSHAAEMEPVHCGSATLDCLFSWQPLESAASQFSFEVLEAGLPKQRNVPRSPRKRIVSLSPLQRRLSRPNSVLSKAVMLRLKRSIDGSSALQWRRARLLLLFLSSHGSQLCLNAMQFKEVH